MIGAAVASSLFVPSSSVLFSPSNDHLTRADPLTQSHKPATKKLPISSKKSKKHPNTSTGKSSGYVDTHPLLMCLYSITGRLKQSNCKKNKAKMIVKKKLTRGKQRNSASWWTAALSTTNHCACIPKRLALLPHPRHTLGVGRFRGLHVAPSIFPRQDTRVSARNERTCTRTPLWLLFCSRGDCSTLKLSSCML